LCTDRGKKYKPLDRILFACSREANNGTSVRLVISIEVILLPMCDGGQVNDDIYISQQRVPLDMARQIWEPDKFDTFSSA
jgi:hypothetical protein